MKIPFSLILVPAILAACAPALTIAPTSVELSISTTPIPPEPTNTPLPPTVEPTPLPSPTVSPTFDYAANGIPSNITLPPSAIEINSPGPNARLVSPVQINANLIPGSLGRVRFELLGEEGESIVRKVLVWNLFANDKQLIETELEFEIEGVAEIGRLVISTDDEFGRLRALSSVDVILLSEGPPEPSFATDTLVNAIILSPAPGEVLTSGPIQIFGLARPRSERPLRVELATRDGFVLDFATVYPDQPEGFDYAVFAITMEAAVTFRQPILITVLETGLRIPGEVHFYSHEFTLTP